MANMYLAQIEAEFMELLDRFQQAETEEEINEIQLEFDLNQENYKDKIQNYAWAIKGLQQDIAGMKDMIKEWQEAKKKLENKVDFLKSKVSGAMDLFGTKSLKYTPFTVSIRPSEMLVIPDEEHFIDQYKADQHLVKSETKFKIDKAEVKSAIKNGFDIEYAYIQVNQNAKTKTCEKEAEVKYYYFISHNGSDNPKHWDLVQDTDPDIVYEVFDDFVAGHGRYWQHNMDTSVSVSVSPIELPQGCVHCGSISCASCKDCGITACWDQISYRLCERCDTEREYQKHVEAELMMLAVGYWATTKANYYFWNYRFKGGVLCK
jgi:hypothetical protein